MLEETHPNIIQKNRNSPDSNWVRPLMWTKTNNRYVQRCRLHMHLNRSWSSFSRPCHTPLEARALAAHDRRITPLKSPPQEPAFSSAPDALAVAPVVRKTRISLQRLAPSRRVLPVAPDVQIGTTIFATALQHGLPHSNVIQAPLSRVCNGIPKPLEALLKLFKLQKPHASLLWNKWKLILKELSLDTCNPDGFHVFSYLTSLHFDFVSDMTYGQSWIVPRKWRSFLHLRVCPPPSP